MKWINDVVFAILAAHVWGSLMLFVWLQAVKRLENKGYTRLLFYLLRAVIVAYLLPLGLGDIKELGKLKSVRRCLVKHNDKFAVSKHRPCRMALQSWAWEF